MFSILRNRLGIPGVISVIALVFAMMGGAYAANNSSGGKATASAKAKKGPRGPKGAKGDPGPAGPQGPAGANGKDGSNGAAGAPGASVTSSSEPKGANCPEGGSKFVAGAGAPTYACNGAEGPAGPTETILPSGQTETGVWLGESIGSAETSEIFATVSYPLRLNFDPTFNWVNAVFGTTEPIAGICEGTWQEPTAAPGQLCVYKRALTNVTAPTEPWASLNTRAGIGLRFSKTTATSASQAFGSWAVTAPAP